MKLLKKLKYLFSKSDDNETVTPTLTPNNIKDYECLDPDKVELLLKKYSCEDEEELVIKLYEKGGIIYDEEDDEFWEEFSEDEKIFYKNPKWEFLKSLTQFGFCMHHENLHGRSLAIKDLVENNYQILSNEYQNHFKELINFTLVYFANEKFSNNDKLLNIIELHFPIMSPYIIRQINQMNPNLQLYFDINNGNDVNFDYQNGYDEFLDFSYKIFTQSFPDENIRNRVIRDAFKHLGNSLISYINTECENKNEKEK